MEEESAFAAYQNATEKSAKKKSPQKNKEKQARPPFVIAAKKHPPKRPRVSSSFDILGCMVEVPPQVRSGSSETVVSEVNNNVTMETNNPAKKNKATKSTTHVNNVREIQSVRVPRPTDVTPKELKLSSIQMGLEAFSHIISDMELKKFMTDHWEKAPLHIQRTRKSHYDFLKVSTRAIDEMLRTNIIEYTKNIDITSYENGERVTHNPDGRAMAGTVWDFYRGGCSVRVINPQTFIASLHQFNATLQEYFHCLVGANIYLTPPNSQGFAPHYDDIEAFVLQIEGKKEWQLYPPRSKNEFLPRESSDNFKQSEIGEPSISVVLNPGDLLYFPRGWIHQAKTADNCHSLHITLSMYQKTSFADLFEELTKQALNNAIVSDVNFRCGLPLDIWSHFGQTYNTFESNQRRETFKNHIKGLFKKIVNHMDIDDAVDKLAIKYQHDALPPVLTVAENVRTTFGTEPIVKSSGKVKTRELEDNTQVRLLRAHIIRLTLTDGIYNLYYYADNSKEYHGSDLNFIEVEEATVDVIKKLIHSYPDYVQIKDLSENIEEAMGTVYSLWERGVLMTTAPL